MGWAVEYIEPQQFVRSVFTGKTTGKDLKEATTHGLALGKKHQTNHYLVDIRQVEITASKVEILRLPKTQYTAEGLDMKSRIALLQPDSAKSRKAAHFYETASLNRGWNVKIFKNQDDALAWLSSK
ncbi:hypothetical protein Ctha_0971 [Chloroherpeton thalassium ATCC 35110]|uniref:STAS/SEC14 domain-containing protein n=1 Tax=Chloroherpeton thalassium (strain ATCC 35110 / GB-78) TaxID=517418 RepID=B3QXG2_CHLT3|nr:STAS/SEC14 domain-containing protein [Chloroherpeton thalassium]ACF13436.1 hypothetical protein Ctha_0971 [Chloroherpeton thalassium ATCC 35110]